MKRILAITLGIVCLGLIGTGFALRYYFRSAQVAQHVTTRLQSLYGGPVHVEQVDVGFKGATLKGIALYEEGSDIKKDTPWLKVASLATDVSLWDLISGDAMPRHVTLSGATLVFRFDREGHLLTRFPGQPAAEEGDGSATLEQAKSFLSAELKDANIVFRKEGCENLLVGNVSARLAQDEGNWTLSGSGNSVELGKLLLNGSLQKESNLATLHLKGESTAHVTQAILDRLPFVPARVWEEVQIKEGDATAALTVTYDLVKDAIHYRLDLDPKNMHIFIPAMDLTAHGMHGKVVVDDNLVSLRQVKMQALGGNIQTDASFDLRGPVTRLNFSSIVVENLNVSELPQAWNVPGFIRKTASKGKLFGTASLETTIAPAELTPTSICTLAALAASPPGFGAEQWLTTASFLAAFPRHQVHFKSQGKGIVRDPANKSESIEFDWHLAPKGSRSQEQAPGVSQTTAEKIQYLLVALVISETTLTWGPPGKQSKEQPDYLDMNLDLKSINLADLLKNLDVQLPFPLEGKASLHLKVSLPADRANDLKAYKIEGTVQTAQLALAGIKLEEATANVTYSQGTLFLKSLKGSIAKAPADKKMVGGTFQGSGQVQLFPRGELRADLHIDRIPLRQLVGREAEKVEGNFSGELHVRADLEKLKSFADLDADGKITSDQVKAYGLSLEQVSGSVQLKNGLLKLLDVQGRFGGAPVKATAELRLRDDYPFLAKLDLGTWELASLQKMLPDNKSPLLIAGAFTADMDLEGKLAPFSATASGGARASNLKIEAFEAQDVKLRWQFDGNKLTMKDITASLYGGQTTGSVVLPIDSRATGNIDLRVNDLQVKQLTRDLRIPLRIDGQVGGLLKGTIPPAAEGQPRTATLHLDLKAPKMRVQNIPTEQLQGKLEYRNGVVDYKLEGKTLGGTFDLDGQVPVNEKVVPLKKEEVKKGRLSIRGVRLSRLFHALNQPNMEHMGGILSLEVNYTHAADLFPVGKGVLRITGLQWKTTRLADDVEGEIVFSEQQLRLRNLEGNIAQGLFDVQLTYYFRQPDRSTFSIRLDRVESAELLAPWLESKIEGPMQVRIRGNLGSTWRGTADFDLPRGKVYGLEIAQWRLPVVWSFSPDQDRAQIDIYETTAQVSRGRATGKLNLTLDHAARLEGHLRFDNVDMREFLRQTIGPGQLGAGQLTGRFDFSGTEVRSLNDLRGNLMASFKQAQVLQLPVLSQIAPVINVGTTTTFQTGDLRARLDRGFFRIQQLALQGNNLSLWMDGTVSLEGRLNLAVIARTGDVGLPSIPLGPLRLRVPPVGPVPLIVLAEASNLLSNLAINLQVTGTVRAPVIQPRPTPLLSQEAFRFFFFRSSLPVIPNS